MNIDAVAIASTTADATTAIMTSLLEGLFSAAAIEIIKQSPKTRIKLIHSGGRLIKYPERKE